MLFRLFHNDQELKHVRCPKPFVPPVPIDVCRKCRGNNGFNMPADDRPPYVVCGWGNKYQNAECIQ